MASTELNYERRGHPVDLIEQLATMHDWAFERSAEDELSSVRRRQLERLPDLAELAR